MPAFFDMLPLPFAALVLGLATGLLAALGAWKSLQDCDLPVGRAPLWCGLGGIGLGILVVYCSIGWGTLGTPEVLPSQSGKEWRVAWHLLLLVLLLMITATDLKGFYILDWNCWVGLGVGLLGATLCGEFQLAHVWVDWNAEIRDLRGPDIPTWLAAHQHLHGLAWSAAGAGCGAALTWLTRWISQWVLARGTLGLGDVFLMGMVGSFLGWQPTVVAVVLAPLLALLLGGVWILLTNRVALPYGPFLALSALLVLLNWGRIWMWEVSFAAGAATRRETTFALRRFFGDPVGLLGLSGLALVLLVVLLGLLRLYKSLPVTQSRTVGELAEAPPDSAIPREETVAPANPEQEGVS